MQLPTIEEYIADLKRRMDEEKVSGTDLGVEMDVHASAVSRWLTLKVEPRLSTIHQIETALASILSKRLAE